MLRQDCFENLTEMSVINVDTVEGYFYIRGLTQLKIKLSLLAVN